MVRYCIRSQVCRPKLAAQRFFLIHNSHTRRSSWLLPFADRCTTVGMWRNYSRQFARKTSRIYRRFHKRYKISMLSMETDLLHCITLPAGTTSKWSQCCWIAMQILTVKDINCSLHCTLQFGKLLSAMVSSNFLLAFYYVQSRNWQRQY